jgi:KaiC/GvpD/RAD55 family RecA-like ATPase
MTKRVPTGIEGFDELIEGGFPEESVNIVSGPSGAAKTLFCLHFIYSGVAEYGEPSVYLSMEEGRKNLRETLKNFGMDAEKYEADGTLNLVDIGEIRKLGTEDFIDLPGLQSILENIIDANKVKRIVVDSVAIIGLRSRYLDDFRRHLFQFAKFLQERQVTALLVTESAGEDLTKFGVEQFIADSFIYLGLEKIKGELVRTILVRKMRLTNHDISVHPFMIAKKGIRVSSDVKVM